MSSQAYIPEQAVLAVTPATPRTGYTKLYKKPDGGWYELADNGIETLRIHNYRQVLSADFTINSAVLSTVPDLSFDIGLGEQWIFEVVLIADVLAAADIRGQVNGPGTGRYVMSTIEANRSRHAGINVETARINLVNGNDEISFRGSISSTAAGTVSFQLRNQATANVQTFYAGSWLKADRVG